MNIRSIARKSGVSTATISRVMNNSATVSPLTREKVLKIIKTSDFQPKVSRPRNFTVGVSIPDLATMKLDYNYTCELIAGIVQCVSKFGISIQVIDMNELLLVQDKRGAFSDYCKQKGVNALLHMLAPLPLHPVFDKIADDGIMQVVLEHQFDRSDIWWIDVDNFVTSADLARNLTQLGAKTFAIVTCERKLKGHMDRYRGFVQGLQTNGITMPDFWDIQRKEISVEAGGAATLNLISSGKIPRVIYYTNAELALGGIKTLLKRGFSLPKDIVVAFFDDSNFANWFPTPVAYLRQPAYEIGLRAGSFFMNSNLKKDNFEILKPELFIGTEIIEALEANHERE